MPKKEKIGPVRNMDSPASTEMRAKAVEQESGAEPGSSLRPESFPVVGIGASAGGLVAFEAFFSAMPADRDSGMAFVVVQHLAPKYKSMLAELVKRYTRMKVSEVTDGMKVEPDCVYIIPPNRDMALLGGTLQLLEPDTPHGHRMPIDYFFRSLAQDQHERAICIVLSGTGGDGTLGARTVKGEGGMVMAQQPESTEYDGMPRSVISAGLADYVLPPAEMPGQLISYVAHAFRTAERPLSPPVPKNEDALKKVLVLVRAQTGHDFSGYKRNTIMRRIERRMAVNQIARLGDYLRFLKQSQTEVDTLFCDFLIGVTSFFRDREAFQTLDEKVIPRLVTDGSRGSSIRVWVPGCATGEEAYSIAILLHERIETLKLLLKVNIFATDIDRKSIEQARSGSYPASIAADITPERLARFFTQEEAGGAYRISKSIRDMLVFSEQNVVKDPPFSKLDLISCRNLLIYMGEELQKKLIPLFHYALNPGGMLFLGPAETLGVSVDLFGALDRRWKLYQRKDDVRSALRPALSKIMPGATEEGPSQGPYLKADNGKSLRELAERELLRLLAPAGALVNARGDILYFYGRTGQYLEPAPGVPGTGANILKMAREGLRRDLTTALHQAAARHEAQRCRGVRVKSNGSFTTLNFSVLPTSQNDSLNGTSKLFLVVFEDAPAEDANRNATAATTNSGMPAGATNCDPDQRIAELAKELKAKEEYLLATTEELETSNEELKSSNEELQSVNEEMQSTNEELETSKEELQSINEELATVNNELQKKVEDLSRANNDMNNLLAGTGVGTVFVDHQLHITRFTPTVTQLINLIQGDVGRPVGHIVSNLTGYDRLVEDVQSVLDTLIPKEIEVQSKSGRWYLMALRPYRTLENVIEGAVVTFVEITEQKRMQAALQEAATLRRLAAVVRDSSEAITMLDFEGRILAWNPAAERATAGARPRRLR